VGVYEGPQFRRVLWSWGQTNLPMAGLLSASEPPQ
jgi:hypothetical protein